MRNAHFGALLSLAAFVLAMAIPAFADDVQANIDWALNNNGAPLGDCPKYAACCLTGAYGGHLPRKLITAQAIGAAKAQQCGMAVGLILLTQCHNADAAKSFSDMSRVCQVLASK